METENMQNPTQSTADLQVLSCHPKYCTTCPTPFPQLLSYTRSWNFKLLIGYASTWHFIHIPCFLSCYLPWQHRKGKKLENPKQPANAVSLTRSFQPKHRNWYNSPQFINQSFSSIYVTQVASKLMPVTGRHVQSQGRWASLHHQLDHRGAGIPAWPNWASHWPEKRGQWEGATPISSPTWRIKGLITKRLSLGEGRAPWMDLGQPG